MERKRNKPQLKSIENFQCNGDAVSSQSALVFRGRAILKQIYLNYDMVREEEMRTNIEMPDDNFLMVVPRLATEGMEAAQEFLQFTPAGVLANNSEGGYHHASREKMALLFIICNADLSKPLTSHFLVKDELKSIKKMSDLANWISNMQNEKDVRKVLERERNQQAEPRRVNKPKPEDGFLPAGQLALILNISAKTIFRHPEQFKPIQLGSRKFYKLSDCLGYKKPGT